MTAESMSPKNGADNRPWENGGDGGGTAQSTKSHTSFEDVYAAMGPPGLYQFTQIAMLLTCTIPMVFINVKYVFISLEPEHHCAAVNEAELFRSLPHSPNSYIASYNESCEIEVFKNGGSSSGSRKSVKTTSCTNGSEFVGGKDVSFITEWELVCDKDGIPQLAQSVVAIGGLVGGLFVNMIGDKYGRWKTLTGSIILTVALDIATAYIPGIYSMIAIRFVTGVVSSGMYVNSLVLPFEMLIEKHRVRYILISGILWAMGVALHSGVGYAFRYHSWRDFHLYAAIMGALPLLFVYFIKESPSWLQSVGNEKRSEEIIKQACKMNKVDFEKVKGTLHDCFRNLKTVSDTEGGVNEVKRYNALDLFRNRKYLVILLITWFAALTHELTTNGLFLTASTLSGNLYLNTALLGIVSIPAYMASIAMLQYVGRRVVIILFSLLAGGCLLVSHLISYADIDTDTSDNISLAFFILGKFGVAGAYNTLIMYTPEVYPTNLRVTGTGMSFTGTNAGGAIAPFLLPLHKAASWAPGVTLCSCCVLTAVLFIRLPETRGRKLKTTLDDEDDDTGKNDDRERDMAIFSVRNGIESFPKD